MGSPRRLPVAVLAASAVLGLLTGVAAVLVATRDQPAAGAGGTTVVESRPAESSALRVVRRWDTLRARAYARADLAALADLYVPGSRTAAADLAVLRGYRERGLRVTGMRTQVLAARVLHESARRIIVLVTDVLLDAVARDRNGHRWVLPHDRASTRRVVLVARDGTWRVVETY
jgi:hypothetical protein